MAFWVHVEKGYTIFIVYFSGFKSLESLARLLKKVLKSCETFEIQDFGNAKKWCWYMVACYSKELKTMRNVECRFHEEQSACSSGSYKTW